MERFRIAVPDAWLDDIHKRVTAFDWDRFPELTGWDDGIGTADLRRLVAYWIEQFDWRAIEKRLNALPQFMTRIEDQPVHFIHFRSDGTRPPLLLLHGWPGSFIEFEHMAQDLVADGHDVVIPSLPGFGFSTPVKMIMGPRRIAGILHALMTQLFPQTRFFIQGGDWGSHIASWMAYLKPDALLGLHLNMAYILAEDAGPETPAEKDWRARLDINLEREGAYNKQQETRPQTLAVGLTDSPVGVAAWIMEKFGVWSDLPARADGSPDLWARFTEEQLLTNIMLYLGPSAMVTAIWIYRGKRLEESDRFPPGTRITSPMAMAAFPDPVFLPTPRSVLIKTYDVVQYTDMPAGGHFAALEQPDLLLADLRRFIKLVT